MQSSSWSEVFKRFELNYTAKSRPRHVPALAKTKQVSLYIGKHTAGFQPNKVSVIGTPSRFEMIIKAVSRSRSRYSDVWIRATFAFLYRCTSKRKVTSNIRKANAHVDTRKLSCLWWGRTRYFLWKPLKGKYWNKKKKKKQSATPSRPRKIRLRARTAERSETITHDACGGEILAGNSDKQLLLAVTQRTRCKCTNMHKVLCTLIDRQRLPARRTY